MLRGWQLRLSQRPLRRTETPNEPRVLSPNNAALYEFLYEENGRFVVRETHSAENKTVQDGLSGPPLHIHLRQTEYFQIKQGVLGVVLNEKKTTLTKKDGILRISPGVRHRFWAQNPVKEDLIFKVWAEPQDVEHGFDENYLRNALGYLRDCQQQNIRPSLFQMALFGRSSDTIFTTPPFWVPMWLLQIVHYIAGCIIGELLLGYRATYPEYNTKPQDNSNSTKKSA